MSSGPHTHVYAHAHLHAHTHARTHTCTHTHACTHTQTHTHKTLWTKANSRNQAIYTQEYNYTNTSTQIIHKVQSILLIVLVLYEQSVYFCQYILLCMHRLQHNTQQCAIFRTIHLQMKHLSNNVSSVRCLKLHLVIGKCIITFKSLSILTK